MSNLPIELASPVSLVLLAPFIAALAPDGKIVAKPTGSLPSPCLLASMARTIVCATSVNAMPLFRAEAVITARRCGLDVLVIRHGQHPESFDEVTVDLVTARGGTVRLLWGMLAFRDLDGSFWLVPQAGSQSPCARIDATGVSLSPTPPYDDDDGRADGAVRAARETVLNLRRYRSGEWRTR